jgi:REP element-mobilizing transposase RayT
MDANQRALLEVPNREWPTGGATHRLTAADRVAALWQRRLWEHWIRDEEDLRLHLGYRHFNSVKHGLVVRPAEWPWPSFHRYVRLG